MNPREGEFQKLQKLGSGSFGTVWHVKRIKDTKHLAWKEIDHDEAGHTSQHREAALALEERRRQGHVAAAGVLQRWHAVAVLALQLPT